MPPSITNLPAVSTFEDTALTKFFNDVPAASLERVIANRGLDAELVARKIIAAREAHGGRFDSLGEVVESLPVEEASKVIDTLRSDAPAAAINNRLGNALMSWANLGQAESSLSMPVPVGLREKMRRARMRRGEDFEHPMELMTELKHSDKESLVALAVNAGELTPGTVEVFEGKTPILSFSGLDTLETFRLMELGVENEEVLAEVTRTPARVKALSASSGIATEKLAAAGPVAALKRLPGIELEHAVLLRDAGYSSVHKLALADPELLHTSLAGGAELAGLELSREGVEAWIETAGTGLKKTSPPPIELDGFDDVERLVFPLPGVDRGELIGTEGFRRRPGAASLVNDILTGPDPELGMRTVDLEELTGKIPANPTEIIERALENPILWINPKPDWGPSEWIEPKPVIETFEGAEGVFVMSLPLDPRWPGPVDISREPAVPTHTEGEDEQANEDSSEGGEEKEPKIPPMTPPHGNEPIPVDEISEEELLKICAAIEHAEAEKKKRDEEERRKAEEERRKLQEEQDRVNDEKEKRRKRRRYRDRKDRERDLRDRRERLNERGEELEERREEVENKREEIEQKDKDLRQREQDARETDPNCRGQECRNIRAEREANQRERLENMRDADSLARDSAEFGRDMRDYNQDAQDFQDLLDTGYGQTRSEYEARKTGEEYRERQSQLDAMKEAASDLRATAEERPLNAQEQRQLDRLEGEITQEQSALDAGPERAALDAAQAESDRIAGELENPDLSEQERADLREEMSRAESERIDAANAFNEAWGDSVEGRYSESFVDAHTGESLSTGGPEGRERQMEEARRREALSNFSGEELNEYGDALGDAIGEIDRAIGRVGEAGNHGVGGNQAREALDQLQEASEDARRHAENMRHARDGVREGIDRVREEKARIRDELRRMGTSEHNTTFHGSSAEADQVENLRERFRALEDAEADLESRHRRFGFAADRAALSAEQAARDATMAGPAARSEAVNEQVDQYNHELERFFKPDGAINRAAAFDYFKGVYAELRRWEGLKGQEQRLERSLDVDNSLRRPGSPRDNEAHNERRRQHLTTVREGIANSEGNLKRDGISRNGEGDGFSVDTTNPLNSGLLRVAENEQKGHDPRAGLPGLQPPQTGQNVQPSQQAEAAKRTEPQQTQPISQTGRRVQYLEMSTANLGSAIDHAVDRGDSQEADRLRTLRSTQENELNELRRVRLSSPSDPPLVGEPEAEHPINIESFVRSQLGGTAPEHPLTQTLRMAEDWLGSDVLQAFMAAQLQDSEPRSETSTGILRKLFVEGSIASHWMRRDWNAVLRLQGRYVKALEMLETMTRKDDGHAKTSVVRVRTELDDARGVLSQSHRNVAVRLSRSEDPTREAVFQTSSTAAKREGQGTSSVTDGGRSRMNQVKEESDDALADALDAGECARAMMILQSRIEAWNGIISAHAEREAEVDPGIHEELAEDLQQMAHLLEEKKRRETSATSDAGEGDAPPPPDDDDENEEVEDPATQASKARLVAAHHLMEAGDLEGALDLMEGVEDDAQLCEWLLALVAEGIGMLAALGESEGDRETTRRFNLKDRLLKIVGHCGADAETRANAMLQRAEAHRERGDEEMASRLFEEAKEEDPGHPVVIWFELEELFKGDPDLTPELLNRAAGILARARGREAEQFDGTVTLKVLRGIETLEELEDFKKAIEESDIPDERKAKLLITIGLAVARTKANTPGRESEVAGEISAIEGWIPKADLTEGEQDDLSAELTMIQQHADAYLEKKNRFQSGTYSAAEMPALASEAMERGELDFAQEIIEAYIASPHLDVLTRAQFLAKVIQTFETLASAAAEAGDSTLADDLSQRSAQLRIQGRDFGQADLDSVNAELENLTRELREARAERQDEEDDWELLLKLANLFTDVDDEALAAAISRVESLEAKIRDLQNRAGLIASARIEFQTMGLEGEELKREVDRLHSEARAQLEDVRRQAAAAADSQTDDVDFESTTDALDAWKAKLAVARIFFSVADNKYREVNPKSTFWRRYDRVTQSSVEREVDRITKELNGGFHTPDGVSQGLRQEYRAKSTHRGLFAWEDKENEWHWEMELLRSDIEWLETRRSELILHGPAIDTQTGAPLTGVQRKALFFEILQRDLRTLEFREERLKDTVFGDLFFGASQAEAETQAFEKYIDSIPEMRAFKFLGDYAGRLDEVNATDYLRALAVALNSIAADHAYDLAEYTEMDGLKTGIVQFWNVVIAPAFRVDPDGQSAEAALARLQAYQTEVWALSDALLRATNGYDLSDEDKAVLRKHGYLADDGNGGESLTIPAHLNLQGMDDDLNLPSRTAWDELVNPWNMGKMILTILIPGGIARGVTGLAIGSTLRGFAGGMIVRLSFESMVFTAVSYPMGYLVDWAGGDLTDQRGSFFDEYFHNLGIFLALGAMGSAFGALSFPAVPTAHGLSQASRLSKAYLGSLGVLQLGTEAALFAGLEGLHSGEGFTLDAFARNLAMILMLRAGGKAQHATAAALARRFGLEVPAPNAPTQGRFRIDPARARAVETLYNPVGRRLAERARLSEKPLSDRSAFEALKRELAEVGIELIERKTPFSRGRRAAVEITSDGRQRIHIDANTARVDVLNEFFKIQELARLGVSSRTHFTSEIEAWVEFNSYAKLERQIFRDWNGMPGRKKASIGFSLYWRNRLADIGSGKIPNRVLLQPHEGIVMGVDRGGGYGAYRRRYLEVTGRELDPASPEALKTLGKRARDAVLATNGRVGPMLGAYERLSYRLLRVKEYLEGLPEGSAPDVVARRLRAERARNRILERMIEIENRLDKAFDRMAGIAAGTVRLGRPNPDIRLLKDKLPNHEVSNQGFHENLRKEYETLFNRGEVLREEKRGLASSNVQRRRQIEAELSQIEERLIAISKEVGGLSADRAMKQVEPGLADLFVDIAGGGGAGEVDAVYGIGNRVIVVEAKGGSSRTGTANSAGYHAEQGTLAHTLITASKMILRGERLVGEGRLVEGQRLIEGGDAIFRGFIEGRLEIYLARTGWKKVLQPDGKWKVTLDSTKIWRARLRWNREGGVRLNTTDSLSVIYPSATKPSGWIRVGRLQPPSRLRYEIVSDGVRVQSPDSLQTLYRDILHTKWGPDGVGLAALPERLVVLKRRGGAFDIHRIVDDPGLAGFRRLAQESGVNVVFGLRIEYGVDRNVEGAVYFGADGAARFIAKGSHSNSVTVNGETVYVHVGIDGIRNAGADGFHVLLGDARPAQLRQARATLGQRATAVNWAGIHRETLPGVDTVDLPPS